MIESDNKILMIHSIGQVMVLVTLINLIIYAEFLLFGTYSIKINFMHNLTVKFISFMILLIHKLTLTFFSIKIIII